MLQVLYKFFLIWKICFFLICLNNFCIEQIVSKPFNLFIWYLFIYMIQGVLMGASGLGLKAGLWFLNIIFTIACTCHHSPTGAPAKPQPFCTPRLRPNVSSDRGVFAWAYLFLLEKEPRRNSGITWPQIGQVTPQMKALNEQNLNLQRLITGFMRSGKVRIWGFRSQDKQRF